MGKTKIIKISADQNPTIISPSITSEHQELGRVKRSLQWESESDNEEKEELEELKELQKERAEKSKQSKKFLPLLSIWLTVFVVCFILEATGVILWGWGWVFAFLWIPVVYAIVLNVFLQWISINLLRRWQGGPKPDKCR